MLAALGWLCVAFSVDTQAGPYQVLAAVCAVQALRGLYYLLGVDIMIYRWRRSRRGPAGPPSTINGDEHK